ncbi:MAG: hypothetical protein JW955_08595 [Sedimentisphaerales bacterium]|nr:hypothetical protein [Sedimentisphaerales bacterium]
MRSRKAIEETIRRKLNFTFGPPRRDQLLARAMHEQEQSRPTEPASHGPATRRMIMTNPSLKWALAAAAVVVVGVGLIGIWCNSAPAAYAFAQTVEAMQGKRSFHIQTYFQQRRKDEFWAEFDKQGNLIRFRQEEDPTPKGPTITIWENGILNRYGARQGLHQHSWLPNTEHGIEGLEGFDPETIVQEINTLVEAGKAVMETDELSRYAKRVTLRVTHKNKDLKQVLVVDPVTKFVVRVDDYWGAEGGEGIHKGIEVLEYNETMDPKLFVPDFPKDAVLMDQVTQEVGMAQGDMTEKEVAVEVVRQAMEAWAQRDYAKAGKLFGGMPPQRFTDLDDIRPARIVSIDPIDKDGAGYVVQCLYEAECDGRKQIVTLVTVVQDVDGQPGRWQVSLFSCNEVLADAQRLDPGSTNAGLIQGQLSDEQVATAVVRQFLEALQAGDYEAAGRLVSPGDATDVKEHLRTVKILQIVFVGPATPLPAPGNKVMVVPCRIVYEEDGRKNFVTLQGLVAQQADRWVLSDLKD